MITDANRNRNGRGYDKHYYTIEDISKASNRANGTIRNAISEGKINIDNLESVIDYCNKRRKV